MSKSSFYASEGPGSSDLELLDWYLAQVTTIYNQILAVQIDINNTAAAAADSAADALGYATDAAASAAAAAASAAAAEDWYNLILGAIGAGSTAYSPAVPADWINPDPTTVAGGLDDLAARVTDIEADWAYAPAVLADWTGSADPGNVKAALDQLASRVTDSEAGAYTPAVLSNWTGSVDPGGVTDALDQLAARVTTGTTEHIIVACSDETTALTAGTAKATFRIPYNFTLSGIRASLTTAQTSGSILTVDVNQNGASILSTKLTIDNTEKTSTTAVTAAVISDTTLDDDAEITFDIDQIGDGTAKGLKVTLIGFRTLGG